jgi:NTE family protein
MAQEFENLALEGGGVWGIAYAGALEELDKIGVLPQIKRVAGTSAGSITALLLALGYSSAEIYKVFSELDYTRFQDHRSINQLLTKYGLYDCQYGLKLFQGWVAEKLGTEDATFQDLHAAGGLDLRVYATNLNSRQIHEFSYAKTQDVPLASAVRASISVPLYFTAVEVGGHLFVDGGAVFDYPMMGFGKGELLNTLGLAFASSSAVATADPEDDSFGYRQPIQYIHRMVTVLERSQSPVLALHEELQNLTIWIDTGSVTSLNFSLTPEDRNFLIGSGRKAVREYFKVEETKS